MTNQDQVAALETVWANDSRWHGIRRGYPAEAVRKLRGSVEIKHTLRQVLNYKGT